MKYCYRITFSFLWLCQSAAAQVYTLSGTITDASLKEPLPGATLSITGSYKAAAADASGFYRITKLAPGTYTLRFSFVGYQPQERTIQLDGDLVVDIALEPSNLMADEVVVRSTRANERTPTTYTNVSKEEIEKLNLGQDLPLLLNFQPSIVTTTDAGAGVGYTGLRIRGTDPTRINVTVNGIPLNDAESQGVFWVNMPDFASSLEGIQVQRGVGTSTNGAGAFGASMNLQTDGLREKPYAEINNSFGSFNTLKNNVMAGTGLMNDHFTVDARLSRISSDGYIERASSDLKSFYLSGGYYGKKDILKLNVFSGAERTYQAWYGVSEADLLTNRRKNIAGTEKPGAPYDNETDNYQQDHYQLIWSHQINRRWDMNTALHYTRGRGYYEQYKAGQGFGRYGLAPLTFGADTTIFTGTDTIRIEPVTVNETDLVRQLWLDNHFYGTVFSFNYQSFGKLQATIGGGINRYEGLHYGEVVWAQYTSNATVRHRYYDNKAVKDDFNVYAKANYQVVRELNAFLDLQYRRVGYDFLGYNRNLENVQQQVALDFFNPKAGLTMQLRKNSELYTSFGIANREPNRNDYTESSPDTRPRHETLRNLEIGYRRSFTKSAFIANFYWMDYKDQLVLTGNVNDVGAYTRTNVERSYRRGIELQYAWKITDQLTWDANATFSQNKIPTLTDFIDDYDNGGQIATTYANTDIAFSPNVIAASQLNWSPVRYFQIGLLSKYVGDQYLDNTSNTNRKLNAYQVNDLRMILTLKPKWMREIQLIGMVYNFLDEKYESNGYTFSYLAGGALTTENFFYPQAGRNYMVQLRLRF